MEQGLREASGWVETRRFGCVGAVCGCRHDGLEATKGQQVVWRSGNGWGASGEDGVQGKEKRGLLRMHTFRAAREVLPQICVVTVVIVPTLKTLRKVTKGQCHLVTIRGFKPMKYQNLLMMIPVTQYRNQRG